ncbi:MAG: hypothetical protein WCV70_01660 [Patescibacteria group bacterium]
MERELVYDGENGRNNYCSCENCNGGRPVRLPKKGQKVYSTGLTFEPAHKFITTLFLSADRKRGMYANYSHPPYIPGLDEKQWRLVISAIERREVGKPTFREKVLVGEVGGDYFDEIAWEGHLWRKKYLRCPGKYCWVSTGSAWKSEGGWQYVGHFPEGTQK